MMDYLFGELYHYGVKGMEWGKRKKSYDEEERTGPLGSPYFRSQKYSYVQSKGPQGTTIAKRNRGTRGKVYTNNVHGYNHPVVVGKGLYKKGSGLGTGPVGTGGKKSVLKTASKVTSNKPKNSKDLGGNQKSIGINAGDRRNRTTQKQKAIDAAYRANNVADKLSTKIFWANLKEQTSLKNTGKRIIRNTLLKIKNGKKKPIYNANNFLSGKSRKYYTHVNPGNIRTTARSMIYRYKKNHRGY